ncbi:TetR/AcrR family transcriptional regulator [Nocardia macrotermitis]|uniref:Putative HTH-type transcriptional regulator n=1 Tax=Nocardia macrotermitis TaxID=2585198 RepID=A0A7K0D8J8_9NOCA|nr:TetR/AcrR family transcriptional regulator [Nocardia macrotermitis]MQY22038.1 putative HTH-type transcriptional regulator [Nocardia macrotermitis]
MQRRDRVRVQTVREIEMIALRLLVEGGPAAITLHAIARELGMTPSALYGYYDSRDELVASLIATVYQSLLQELEAACDAMPATDAAGQILAWASTFRHWAVANPHQFRLLYGDAIPGYTPPAGHSPAEEAACRVGAGFAGLAAAAWPHAAPLQATGTARWADFDDILVDRTRAAFPDLPPEGLALALRLWGRMHGLVALEIWGHLTPLTRDPAALYLAEIHDLIRSLGLTTAPKGN